MAVRDLGTARTTIKDRLWVRIYIFIYTAISRNVVGKKQKTAQANPERYFGIRSMNFNKSIDTLNPRCLVRTVTILDGEPYG